MPQASKPLARTNRTTDCRPLQGSGGIKPCVSSFGGDQVR